MRKIEDFIEDSKDIEFEDEKIITNLYHATLVKSLREIKSIEEKKVDCSKSLTGNQWIYELCEKIKSIPTISFDQLKLKINADYKSCDCFFYHAEKSEDKYSLLLEFKNVNRSGIIKYLNYEDTDSIYLKVKDTIRMLVNDIEFEDGFSGMDLVNHTHLIIVYGERADTVTEIDLRFGRKGVTTKDKNGRQNRAVPNIGLTNSRKINNEILKSFGEKIHSMKLASCPKGYFKVTICDPEMIKRKGEDSIYNYTLFSKHNFIQLINEINYFDDWNWGKYAKYFPA